MHAAVIQPYGYKDDAGINLSCSVRTLSWSGHWHKRNTVMIQFQSTVNMHCTFAGKEKVGEEEAFYFFYSILPNVFIYHDLQF